MFILRPAPSRRAGEPYSLDRCSSSTFMTNRPLLSLVLLCATLLADNCLAERDTEISVEGGTLPRFIMKGSGKLVSLRVGGPRKQREGVADEPYIYWKIEIKENGSARHVEGLGSITYGAVPEGYIQAYPNPGMSPLPLVESERYSVRAITMNANGGITYFEIHNGEVVVDRVNR
jgi:hypothetical protein